MLSQNIKAVGKSRFQNKNQNWGSPVFCLPLPLLDLVRIPGDGESLTQTCKDEDCFLPPAFPCSNHADEATTKVFTLAHVPPLNNRLSNRQQAVLIGSHTSSTVLVSTGELRGRAQPTRVQCKPASAARNHREIIAATTADDP